MAAGSEPRSRSLGLLLAFIAGLALARVGLPPGHAQTNPGLVRGGGSAGAINDDFKFRTLKNNRASVRTPRNVLVVNAAYGRLVTVTPIIAGKGGHVLWFEAQDGTIHNVVIENPRSTVRILRQQ